MTFASTLEQRRAPRRLGDVRLRYEGEVLVGETLPGRGIPPWSPPAATAAGLSASMLGVALSLVGGAPVPALIALVLLTGAGLWGGTWLRALQRGRRAFAVHFVEHTLRLDRPGGLAGRPRTRVVPFSDVRVAGVTRAPRGGYALEVELVASRAGGAERLAAEVLVSSVRAAELDDAERVAELLRAAFGLTPPAPPSASR